ncbi:hypothetical protein [Bradyrhizobium lupini]|uniref:hypothetical protein n=1 Tax=Rhizobium lupini TaxID=136996 RepID=UPI0034C6C67D
MRAQLVSDHDGTRDDRERFDGRRHGDDVLVLADHDAAAVGWGLGGTSFARLLGLAERPLVVAPRGGLLLRRHLRPPQNDVARAILVDAA